MRGPLLTYTLLSEIVGGCAGGKPPTEWVSPDNLPAGTYKAVEKNGTICPELPGLTDFEMVVTDGGEGQLVNLTAIAAGERLTMENAIPVKWYSSDTVYNLTRFGSETIEGIPKCFHVEPSIDVAPFVEGLYRTLQQNQEQKTGPWFGSQLLFCYTNLGLMVGIGAEKTGKRWHATRYAFRIHFPGLPTYDYICKASPSITRRKKREHVQQELLPHRESREWYSHESTFEPPPKIGRLEPAKISAAAASEEGTDGLHGKRTSTVPLVDHSYAMELDEVSPEARNPPPARVFEDAVGKRLSPMIYLLEQPRASSTLSKHSTPR
ncbi:hypothetical protein FOZ63_031918, partial [Perkinsus olseni]